MAHSLLQSVIFPDPQLIDEPTTFFRLSSGAALELDAGRIRFEEGASVSTNTYFNIFNIGIWGRHCQLEQLSLLLRGSGAFALRIIFQADDYAQRTVLAHDIQLASGKDTLFDVPPELCAEQMGVLFFELTCLGAEGTIEEAAWSTSAAPQRAVKLALAITTFRREEAVTNTVKRFKAHLAKAPRHEQIELIVVDNGQSAPIKNAPNITRFDNENLGGAGGFARGLIEAKARGASHCLFMDDDASVFMDAIDRTLAFLTFSCAENIAVAGAMSHSDDAFRIWENGARFHNICRPIAMGTDLRQSSGVLKLLFKATQPSPPDLYGGWWFFAFPISEVKHMPFPFFVRGDDVSFSLAHDFNIVTLPGVMSFQDEDFNAKETPLTVYLDLRSHLAHHLALPQKEIGRLGIMRIIARFWLRSLLSFHYETVQAAALGAQDALSGPAYFDQNADVAARRKEIGTLYQVERWKPLSEVEGPLSHEPDKLSEERLFARLLMKFTLNGHLLPAFKRLGASRVLPSTARMARRPIWGAKSLTYISKDGRMAYRTEIDAAKAMRVTRACFAQMWRVLRHYPAIRDSWREGYAAMTTESYWHEKLGLNGAEPPPTDQADKHA